jgi:hypothetical protein
MRKFEVPELDEILHMNKVRILYTLSCDRWLTYIFLYLAMNWMLVLFWERILAKT